MTDAHGMVHGEGGPSGRRRVGRRIAIHAGAALVTVSLWVVVMAITGEIGFESSVCGTATAGDVWGYRVELLKFGLLGALVPLAIGALLRYLGERSWPWFALATIAAIFVVVSALHAQVQQFCF